MVKTVGINRFISISEPFPYGFVVYMIYLHAQCFRVIHQEYTYIYFCFLIQYKLVVSVVSIQNNANVLTISIPRKMYS